MGKIKGKVLKNRFKLIENYVKGKDILDLGCVDHFSETEKDNDFWLHKFIKERSKSITGVDLEEKEVNKLNKKGYNIIVDNVETFNLNKKFDVIVAGELIEHLRNVGMFLDSVKKHMNKDSYFILTTPNAPAIGYFLRSLILDKNNENEFHHTYWFDYKTLIQNFEYAGYEVVEWHYFFDSIRPWYKYYLERMFVMIRNIFAPNILFVLKKNDV